MGRPLKEIDGGQVRKLATIGCTLADIARYFSVDEKTIRNRFSEEYALGREAGKVSIRRMQFKAAAGGSVPMLIHLGKTQCGQTDRIELNANVRTLTSFEVGDDGRNPDLPLSAEAEGIPEDAC